MRTAVQYSWTSCVSSAGMRMDKLHPLKDILYLQLHQLVKPSLVTLLLSNHTISPAKHTSKTIAWHRSVLQRCAVCGPVSPRSPPPCEGLPVQSLSPTAAACRDRVSHVRSWIRTEVTSLQNSSLAASSNTACVHLPRRKYCSSLKKSCRFLVRRCWWL